MSNLARPERLIYHKPTCAHGYTVDDMVLILGDRYKDFLRWMYGEEFYTCVGQRWNWATEEFQEECDGEHHGIIIYPWDLRKYEKVSFHPSQTRPQR